MSHSPGPWTWHGEDLYAVGGKTVVYIGYDVHGDRELKIRDEDRKLIAAAPRMLDMLRKLEWFTGMRGWCPVCLADEVKMPRHVEDCELAALLEELK